MSRITSSAATKKLSEGVEQSKTSCWKVWLGTRKGSTRQTLQQEVLDCSTTSDSFLVAAEEVTRDTPRIYQDQQHTLTYLINWGSFCHVNLSVNQFFKIQFRFFKLNFVSCPKFSKTYSPSVFFIDGLKLYVFESLKWKHKF